MIRINLGSDQLEKSAKQVAKGSNSDLTKAFAPIAKRMKLDMAGTLTLVAGMGMAALFPLFLDQYKTFVTLDYSSKRQKIQATLEGLHREIGKLTPYQKELESYEQQKKLVASRLAVVKELLGLRNMPVITLDAMGQNLPRRTWINTMDLQFNDVDGTLQIQGSSYSNEEIAEYVDKLTSSVYLKDVALEDVTTRIDDKIEIRSFQLTAKSKGGGLGRQVAAEMAMPRLPIGDPIP